MSFNQNQQAEPKKVKLNYDKVDLNKGVINDKNHKQITSHVQNHGSQSSNDLFNTFSVNTIKVDLDQGSNNNNKKVKGDPFSHLVQLK